MRNKILTAALLIAVVITLTACHSEEDKELTVFKENVEIFCSNISDIDTAINNVDTSLDDYIEQMLSNLDRLDEEFTNFANLDFPERFDYLEPTADEAGRYMSEAVKSFRDAYTNEAYDEEMFAAKNAYARENYSRAYKRIQIIITFLHGEEPENVGLSTSEASQ